LSPALAMFAIKFGVVLSSWLFCILTKKIFFWISGGREAIIDKLEGEYGFYESQIIRLWIIFALARNSYRFSVKMPLL